MGNEQDGRGETLVCESVFLVVKTENSKSSFCGIAPTRELAADAMADKRAKLLLEASMRVGCPILGAEGEAKLEEAGSLRVIEATLSYSEGIAQPGQDQP